MNGRKHKKDCTTLNYIEQLLDYLPQLLDLFQLLLFLL